MSIFFKAFLPVLLLLVVGFLGALLTGPVEMEETLLYPVAYSWLRSRGSVFSI